MISILYGGCLFVTILLLVHMAQKNYNSIDIYHWTIMLLVPLIIMAYWLKTRVETVDAAYVLMCFQYLDSTFLMVSVIFYLVHIIGLNPGSWMKIALYGLASVHMLMVCLCLDTDLYYSNVEVIRASAGNIVHVTGGPLMKFHFAYLGFMVGIILLVWIYAFIHRGKFAMNNLVIYSLIPAASIGVYVVDGALGLDYSLLPIAYAAADVVITFYYDIAHTRDISYPISEHQKSEHSRGYTAIGMNGRFLSCNDTSYTMLPFLRTIRPNEKLPENDSIARSITRLIYNFDRGGSRSIRYHLDDKTYECEVSYFSIRSGGSRRGYLLDIHDATEEQEAYDLVQSYNQRLNSMVEEKTEHIRDMQRKIVLGMADMIETRDNNTGGHVKRTSDIIRIIVDEIKRQGAMMITDQMAEDIVRAAPTHDLGKMTIDDSILNKPGRFTDEEYAIMKTHSAKSGEMVMILLDQVEEERFVKVAYNVARYHHERWDGRGYPEGLVGTQIPMEARIMAIADVYDALVSKRVYKDSMSFEKSAAIMCECMGTQFDPNLKAVFLGCREKLEDYYRE